MPKVHNFMHYRFGYEVLMQIPDACSQSHFNSNQTKSCSMIRTKHLECLGSTIKEYTCPNIHGIIVYCKLC